MLGKPTTTKDQVSGLSLVPLVDQRSSDCEPVIPSQSEFD